MERGQVAGNFAGQQQKKRGPSVHVRRMTCDVCAGDGEISEALSASAGKRSSATSAFSHPAPWGAAWGLGWIVTEL